MNDSRLISTLAVRWRTRRRLLAALFVVPFILLAGTLFFSLAEQWSFADAFYFSVITLTTVGYGDLVPTTELTRSVTAIFVLCGVTTFGLFLRWIVRHALEPASGSGPGARFVLNDHHLARQLSLPSEGGVVVLAVRPGGRAFETGLRSYDVVLSVEDKPIAYPDDLVSALSRQGIGRLDRFTVMRGNELRELVVRPAVWR
ncbi:hypothetical protein RE428_33450 [Marinobacter nanhaiticus D15-8W]|uniref:PDZ domain-containing protein n=1 Tax=Marinobacter nanhaiticus D15-8W TaxID=626887 RepID=N6WY52_9GAMM|nr:ion channel [Marinobacter nanhaiticus]ENO16536.1 PDZ domain-containing protein [Marinobacter nanhaiticus D15-8W]BES72327.1 hypothetical protein RE428_33450 [Marinobacter nanhaiticus D15-8W]